MYTMVITDLVLNCVLFTYRHLLLVITLMLPYSIFEMLFPHVYMPIDLKKMLGIEMAFHPPILTILMILGAFPSFLLLEFIQKKKLMALGSPFDEIVNELQAKEEAEKAHKMRGSKVFHELK